MGHPDQVADGLLDLRARDATVLFDLNPTTSVRHLK
jgi:hypothetical protein